MRDFNYLIDFYVNIVSLINYYIINKLILIANYVNMIKNLGKMSPLINHIILLLQKALPVTVHELEFRNWKNIIFIMYTYI